jgi:tetratricopeptide (TPR) repeat protein
MSLRRTICIVTLSLSIAQLSSLCAQERPKQQAKDLADKARGESNDRVKQVQDFCAAAQLEPKDKKYQETCNSFRSGLIQDDTAWLASAIAAYKNHDLDRAESQAKLVTNYDEKLSGQARFLLERIKSERLMNQVQTAWMKGDFQTVIALAQTIANPELRASANVYVNNVGVYRGYIDQAQKAEQSNPQEAIQLLTQARELNPNGPNDPAGKIAELQRAMQVKAPPTPPTPTPKTPGDSAAELAKKVNKLMGDAKNSEKQGDLQGALNDYGMVLKLQPGNSDAQSNSDRIEQAIKNDPAAAKNELITAIRYFYNSQFDDARRALMNYLESPQTAKNPGVADFYLGATLVERSMLQTPRANWKGPSPDALSAFQEARKANYNPVRAYVSPTLLKIWDLTAQ